jgi:hypothetical protein
MAIGSGFLGVTGGIITLGLIFNAISGPQPDPASALFALAASAGGAYYIGQRLARGNDAIEQEEHGKPQYGPPTYRR